MKSIRASVIIPNWNGRKLLVDCLSSLRNQSFKNFEVIVVDNGSSDESVDFIKENYPWIRLLENKENYGFAKGCNIGVLASKAEFVILLNNDTKVDKNWLKELIKTSDDHPEVISVGCKLLNYYNKNLIDGVGISINEVGQAISIGFNEKDVGQYEKEMYIFGATGGAALFRRDLFIELGMFDERYFMYFEEVDLAFRAQFMGYKSVYTPKALVYHKHKASSKKVPAKLEYWQYRNMIMTLIKDYPSELMLRRGRIIKILLVYLNTIIFQLRNGYIWPPIFVQFWLLIHLPNLLHDRFRIQKNKKVQDSYIEEFLTPKKISFYGLFR